MVNLSQCNDDEGAYSRISIEDGSDVDKEAPQAAKKLLEAMSMRERYVSLNPRQLRWAFEGRDAFSTDNLPQASKVRVPWPVYLPKKIALPLPAFTLTFGLACTWLPHDNEAASPFGAMQRHKQLFLEPTRAPTVFRPRVFEKLNGSFSERHAPTSHVTNLFLASTASLIV